MTHFLGALVRPGAEPCWLVNERTGAVVADELEAALDSRSRRKGLLGRDRLPDGHGLVIAPCNGIHTWFMRFPIDVAFVARDGRVLKTIDSLGAWRVALAVRAFATIELPAGLLRNRGVVAGDRLALRSTVRVS